MSAPLVRVARLRADERQCIGASSYNRCPNMLPAGTVAARFTRHHTYGGSLHGPGYALCLDCARIAAPQATLDAIERFYA
jgi:hypothetical protein